MVFEVWISKAVLEKAYKVLEKASKSWKRLLGKTSMPRGGANHKPKPWVDVGLLYQCLEKHKDLLANLGAYEHIGRSNAPDAKGLFDTLPLWKALVRLEPTCTVHAQPLRQSLLSLLAADPELNKSSHSGNVWSNLKMQRLTVLLTHVRNLARNKRSLGPVAGKLTKVQYVDLLSGLNLVEVEEQPEELGKAPSLGKDKDPEEASPEKGERKLKISTSDASMDSTGLPLMFQSPKKVDAGKKPLEKGKAASSSSGVKALQRPGSRLHEAMGYGLEKPKGKKKAQKSGMKKPSSCLGKGKPAAKAWFGKARVFADPTAERKPWKRLRRVMAEKGNVRAYIQGQYEDGPLHLVVEVTEKRCPHYLKIIDNILASLETDHLTKAEALEMRDKLLKQYC